MSEVKTQEIDSTQQQQQQQQQSYQDSNIYPPNDVKNIIYK